MEDEDGDEKANVITEEERLLPGGQDRICFRSRTGYDTIRMPISIGIHSTVDGSRVASRERPVPPGRSPGGRRVTLPLSLRVPGEGLPPGTVPGAECFPREGAGVADSHHDAWRKHPVSSTTATKQ